MGDLACFPPCFSRSYFLRELLCTHTHTRSSVYTLFFASLFEIEFSLRDFDFLSVGTHFKRGFPMIPNQEKKVKKKNKKEKKKIEKSNK